MNQFFSIFLIYKWQDFSYVFKVENDVFVTLLMWDLKLKSESKITPKRVTSDLIKGVNFPRLLNSISLFVLGPTSRISVLSSFNFKKLLLIHLHLPKIHSYFNYMIMIVSYQMIKLHFSAAFMRLNQYLLFW